MALPSLTPRVVLAGCTGLLLLGGITGAATVDPKKDNQICFGASSTIYTPTAGNSYTLTLYFQSN